MKKLFKKAISAALAVTVMMSCSIPCLVASADDAGVLEKVPYTVIRSNGAANSTGQIAVYNDGQISDSYLEFYYLDKDSYIKGYGGANTFKADQDNGVVLKFPSSDTEITNIILHGGQWQDQNIITEPQKNLKIRYSSSTDYTTLNKSTTDELLKSTTWTELTAADYTITDITNNKRQIQKNPAQVYKLNGVNTKTDSTGTTDFAYQPVDRAQQILAVNLKEPVTAGSLYIEYAREDRNTIMVLTEIEIYNNKSGNILFGQGMSSISPAVISRDGNFENIYSDRSVFGTIHDYKGSYIEYGGITLTNGKKIIETGADRWYIEKVSQETAPYVEYDISGEELSQLVIYSGYTGKVSNVDKRETTDKTYSTDTYKYENGTETVYGAVDPAGVTVQYTQDGEVWNTVDAVKIDEASADTDGRKLTVSFDKIAPQKIRVNIAAGAYAEEATNSTIVVKEIEAYNIEKFTVNEFAFDKTAVTAGATLKVNYDITNNLKMNEKLSVILGVFEDNKLINCSAKTLNFTSANNVFKGFANVTVPSGVDIAGLSVRAFLWDNENLKPLVECVKSDANANPTVHIVGDSIYADYTVYTQHAPDFGIGQAFTEIFAETGVTINNKAIPGAGSYDWDGNAKMNRVLDEIEQGDYVLVSFCHNDQKTLTEAEYKANLSKIATEVKAEGGIPIFITAIPRYRWNEDKTLKTTHTTTDSKNAVQAMIDAGTENNVPVINLNAHLRELYTAEDTTETTYEYFYSKAEGEDLDRTHLSEAGANYCANWLIQQFESMGFPFV